MPLLHTDSCNSALCRIYSRIYYSFTLLHFCSVNNSRWQECVFYTTVLTSKKRGNLKLRPKKWTELRSTNQFLQRGEVQNAPFRDPTESVIIELMIETKPNPSSSLSLGPAANATDVLQPLGLLYYSIPPSS